MTKVQGPSTWTLEAISVAYNNKKLELWHYAQESGGLLFHPVASIGEYPRFAGVYFGRADGPAGPQVCVGWRTTESVVSFSKLNKLFSGYFDPNLLSPYNTNNEFSGDLANV